MEFLKTINDVAASTNSTFIVPIDGATLNEKSRSMLSGAFDETIESREAGIEGDIGAYNKLVVRNDAADCFSKLSQRDPGEAAMCISKTFPKKLSTTYDLENVRMYWLSNTEADVNTIRPSRMDFEMMKSIVDFFKENEGSYCRFCEESNQ